MISRARGKEIRTDHQDGDRAVCRLELSWTRHWSWDRQTLQSFRRPFCAEGSRRALNGRYPIASCGVPHLQVSDAIADWPLRTGGRDIGLPANGTTSGARKQGLGIFKG
jgi:hypothetical protein